MHEFSDACAPFTPDYFNVNEMLHFMFTLRATDQPNCYDLSGKIVNGGCPIVPEPTTLSLLGVGGLLAAWRRRK